MSFLERLANSAFVQKGNKVLARAIEWYCFAVFYNYINFGGRASRSEFFSFMAVNIMLLIFIANSMSFHGALGYIFFVALPAIAVCSRRVKDSNSSVLHVAISVALLAIGVFWAIALRNYADDTFDMFLYGRIDEEAAAYMAAFFAFFGAGVFWLIKIAFRRGVSGLNQFGKPPCMPILPTENPFLATAKTIAKIYVNLFQNIKEFGFKNGCKKTLENKTLSLMEFWRMIVVATIVITLVDHYVKKGWLAEFLLIICAIPLIFAIVYRARDAGSSIKAGFITIATLVLALFLHAIHEEIPLFELAMVVLAVAVFLFIFTLWRLMRPTAQIQNAKDQEEIAAEK